jgi:bifunctional polynucleotide phosphatase/kinase
MTPSPTRVKKRGADEAVSSPPAKKKVQSGTTSALIWDLAPFPATSADFLGSIESAIVNFFTPSSQKPKDKTVWSERAPDDDTPETLLVGRYETDTKNTAPKRRKIAAFDLVRVRLGQSAMDWNC